MIGLLGGVHCVGMCGGIVSALSIASRPRRPFPVPVVAVSAGSGIASQAFDFANLSRVIAYNAGRIGSYAVAGAMAGGLAQGVRSLVFISSLQFVGYWLANLMLVALGLYLMNAWHGLARLEAAGQILWRTLQPLSKHLLPMDSPGKALMLGGVWGWLPCGMVYSVLLTAMLSGSAVGGASVMLAFGLGTLPAVMGMGMLGMQLKVWTRKRSVRVASGMVVLMFGLLGLWRASGGLPASWLDAICLTPASIGVHQGAH